MADLIEFKISGLDQLQKSLEELPREVARKVLREGLRDGANEMRNAMVEAAPQRTGFLSRHFNIKLSLRGNDLAGTAHVGPAGRMYYPGRGSAGRGVATGRRPHSGGQVPVVSVARFLEFGTSRMAAKPFMRPAFESAKGRVLDIIIDKIREAIARFTK